MSNCNYRILICKNRLNRSAAPGISLRTGTSLVLLAAIMAIFSSGAKAQTTTLVDNLTQTVIDQAAFDYYLHFTAPLCQEWGGFL